jgi:hypothetical protein
MSRRLKRIGLYQSLIKEFLTKDKRIGVGTRVIDDGLPATATFCYSYFDNSEGIGYMVFQDESFEEVDEGQVIPTLYPIMQQINLVGMIDEKIENIQEAITEGKRLLEGADLFPQEKPKYQGMLDMMEPFIEYLEELKQQL